MWKIIPDTDGAYSANSETGQIKGNTRLGFDGRKLKEVILKSWVQNSGYEVVSLRLNGKTKDFLVHRLIGKTFLENFSEKLDINHIDGNKRNNCLSNLEVCTRSYNILHARKIGLVVPSIKQKETMANIGKVARKFLAKPIAKCNLSTKEVIETFEAAADVERKYGFKVASISRVANGKQKSSYGYFWKWLEKCND